ncbi:MAG: hypothetical protein KGL12_09735 [Rhodospirillales bacterium]|nr:hypothetical protein [Rhodospirillales bacterium]
MTEHPALPPCPRPGRAIARRSLIATAPALLLARTAWADGLRSTANFAITKWSLVNGTLSLQGTYPAPGTPALPKSYDYTLDGGAHWVAAGGFAMDSGAWDSWVYKLDVPPGRYTLAIRDHADPSRIAVAPGFAVVTANTAPATIRFEAVALSAALPEGFLAGTLIAEGGTPLFPLVLHLDPAGPALRAAAVAPGRWNLYVAPPGLHAGPQRLRGSVASKDQVAHFAIDLQIRAGRQLDPSRLQVTAMAGLNNASPLGGKVFSLAMQGRSGGSFSIVDQDAPADPDTQSQPRYTLHGAEGFNTNTLSAGKDPIRIAWSDGTDTCVSAATLAIADTIGSGPHVAVAGPAALAATMGKVSADARGRYRGATVTLAPGRYETGWLMPAALSGWNDNGFDGPCTFGAAPGEMPVMRQDGAWIQNGKGWLETLGWDVDIVGLEFADLAQSYPGEVGNFAAIKLNAGVLGRTRIRGIYAHHCINGVLGGQPGQKVEITDSEFAHCGGGDGYTHNFYLADVTHALVRNVVSWGARIGHCGKIRAAASLVEHCVFADGAEGTASYLLDLPDGGAHVVRHTVFEKGPHAQNDALLRYGEECHSHHPTNTLLVEECVFINRTGTADKISSGYIVRPTAVQIGLASGGPASAVVRNCTFYGFTEADATRSDGANATLRLEGTNRFLPLAQAPAPASYMHHPFATLGYRSTTLAQGG